MSIDKISHNVVESQGHKYHISSQSQELTESITVSTGSLKPCKSKEPSEFDGSFCLLYPLNEDFLSHVFDNAKHIMLFLRWNYFLKF